MLCCPSYVYHSYLHSPFVVTTVAAVGAEAAAKGARENTSGAPRQESARAGQVDQGQGYPETGVAHGGDLAPGRPWRDAAATCEEEDADEYTYIRSKISGMNEGDDDVHIRIIVTFAEGKGERRERERGGAGILLRAMAILRQVAVVAVFNLPRYSFSGLLETRAPAERRVYSR